MIEFYSPEIEDSPYLPEGESNHCCRVLRMKRGDLIPVTDGKGNRYECEIIEDNPRKTELRIISKKKDEGSRDYKVTLAVAPTKNSDRMEWLMEKATELGVDKVVLLRCMRSERKVQKTERLQKVMISAMKQSLSCRLPELTELTDFKEFIALQEKDSQKFFGYCAEGVERRDFKEEITPGRDIVILIGPEGDFTPEEVAVAMKKGFLPVTFGKRRLRTETAALYALCHALS